MNTYFTHHAKVRARQRGVPTRTIDLLMRYGRRTYSHDGACIVTFDRAARDRIERECGHAAAQLKLSAYAVLDATRQVVITLGHRSQRVRRD